MRNGAGGDGVPKGVSEGKGEGGLRNSEPSPYPARIPPSARTAVRLPANEKMPRRTKRTCHAELVLASVGKRNAEMGIAKEIPKQVRNDVFSLQLGVPHYPLPTTRYPLTTQNSHAYRRNFCP